MKKLLLVLLFVPLVSFGQKLNKDSNGYTEVIEVELSKKDIHPNSIQEEKHGEGLL